MRRLLPFTFFLLAATARAEVVPLFSPVDNVEKAIVTELNKATVSIHCALYGITNSTLTATLVNAANRGLDVKIALDRNQSAGPSDKHEVLSANGVSVAIKKTYALNHNKYCVLDGKTVIMGSWNWSGNAQKQDNSEIIVRKSPSVSARFIKDFGRIWRRDSDAR